jgi:hypothetical protein
MSTAHYKPNEKNMAWLSLWSPRAQPPDLLCMSVRHKETNDEQESLHGWDFPSREHFSTLHKQQQEPMILCHIHLASPQSHFSSKWEQICWHLLEDMIFLHLS